MVAGGVDPVDLVGDRLQPGPAVLIGEGLARAHLGDVAGGMKSVTVLVAPAQPLCQSVANGALARAGYAHHDERAGHLARFTVHENSPEAPPDPLAKWSRRWNVRDWPAGSRHRTRASRSRAFRIPRPRTAFRRRNRAPARSGSPSARTARH